MLLSDSFEQAAAVTRLGSSLAEYRAKAFVPPDRHVSYAILFSEGRVTHWSGIQKMLPYTRHNPIHILPSLQKPQPLRERDLAHDIEGEHLQPGIEFADLPPLHEPAIQLLEENTHCWVDIRFEWHQITHGVDTCDWLFENTMEVLVQHVKQSGHGFSSS